MTARIIDGKAIAAKVRGEVAASVAEFRAARGVIPGITVVIVGDDPASHVYVRSKERAAEEVGMSGKVVKLPADTTQEQLIQTVESLNKDASVHGILVQIPLPDHLDEDEVVRAIDPRKDVDGLHPENVGLLFSGQTRFAPATPSGVQRILVEEGVEVRGAHVVIVGRSNLVGKPLAGLLLGRGKGANATVTVCHTGTRDLAAETRRADILVSATGIPGSITGDMVKQGAVVIDVGTTRVPDSSKRSGFRLAGDVVFDEACEVASAITPVPGGVGPMTIAMLLSNVLAAAKAAASVPG
ncbi:MAG: bifunctional 5,10-methylenetetrahydrofolate dehydrogenase/5,10-methenyltetrahydrofolate cyclohydrolase [Chloroflexi bacterium]|nr:bifunctional 5,10-methylenetetrahydrofolate dehydrogenase/5,10-methenyltetrahydrofolate cyclohydrolase [Chloroflexota bacterium]MDA1298124.1 bifunctional 5,10-methylenetetrahydrofolate dehydrogenase/5,10-methenyltetrahydrofolate cyclohydrolase [Chloroflexota bacterium]